MHFLVHFLQIWAHFFDQFLKVLRFWDHFFDNLLKIDDFWIQISMQYVIIKSNKGVVVCQYLKENRV